MNDIVNVLTETSKNYQNDPKAQTISTIVAILSIIAVWMIFKKAGEKGWLSLIPFVNLYKLFKIAWGNGWWFLLCFVPVANIIVYIMVYSKLAKAFGHSKAFGLGLIFLNTIFMLVLGFDKSTYQGPVA